MTAPTPRPARRIARWLKQALSVPLALLILFEEWGWEPLAALMARIARWRALAWTERRIRALPPYAALVAFALPWLALLPVKLGALALIGAGRPVLGAALIVAAKLVGTAVLARLFALTRPALLRLGWFAAAYARWSGWKATLLAWVRASPAWRWGQRVKRRVRQRLARWRRAWRP